MGLEWRFGSSRVEYVARWKRTFEPPDVPPLAIRQELGQPSRRPVSMELGMPMLINLAGMSVALYLIVVAAAWLGQRHLMYVPDPVRVLPEGAGLHNVREQVLESGDGARIVTWRAERKHGRPTILYLHGNAG